jgi:hypothetical protein
MSTHFPVGVAIGFTKVKHGQNVWMLELGQNFGFLLKATQELRVTGEYTGEINTRMKPLRFQAGIRKKK